MRDYSNTAPLKIMQNFSGYHRLKRLKHAVYLDRMYSKQLIITNYFSNHSYQGGVGNEAYGKDRRV
jgi:hypothetical protein